MYNEVYMKTGVKSGQCQGSSCSMSSNDTCSITTVLLHSPAAVSDVCSMCCLSVTEGSLDKICCVTSTSDLLLFLLKYQRSITNTTKQVYFLHKKRMFFFLAFFTCLILFTLFLSLIQTLTIPVNYSDPRSFGK